MNNQVQNKNNPKRYVLVCVFKFYFGVNTMQNDLKRIRHNDILQLCSFKNEVVVVIHN